MELKKCARCGKFITSNVDVCEDCVRKDSFEIEKLKGFFENSYTSGITKTQVSLSTGISSKNLNRYLNYEEFNGIYLKDEFTEVINDKNQDA